MDILFEDNHLLAVNKPAGLLTQPSGTEQDSVEAQAKAWIKKKMNKPGEVYLHAVHRLDKPVSGIVLFARTSKALTRLNAAIRSRETCKTYYALVSKRPEKIEGVLEHRLQHGEFEAEKSEDGKLSRLHYKVYKTGRYCLLEIHPETGRYHQIRIQLSEIGSPIIGDVKYGGIPWSHEGIALHHGRLQLEHPVTHERIAISAPIPSTWPSREV